jgi:uncharacterized protein with NRDE domain
MCLILFSYKSHPKYKLILAGNRDEFYSRPTTPMHWWEEYPGLLAGKDLKMGGTWLGITKRGKFATLTNYRDFHHPRVEGPSRGFLVRDCLMHKEDAQNYLKKISHDDEYYDGYNMLAGKVDNLYYHSNKKSGIKRLSPGIFGLSNAFLDTAWEKVQKGKRLFKNITENPDFKTDEIFKMLTDDEQFPYEKLPDTGIDRELEKQISSMFVKTKDYGTRTSTVLTVDNSGNVVIEEMTHQTGDRLHFEFGI